MTRWLVTRPRADAEVLAATLGKMGHGAVLSPMMIVNRCNFAPISWSGYKAILFTSKNAVIHGGPYSKPARSLPVFTVGETTAAAARAAGFVSVSSANGNVDDLADTLASRPSGGPGRYIHLCGPKTKGDLRSALAASGASVERFCVYTVQPAKTLTTDALQGLKAGTLDGAIFLSPKTAKTFAGLAKEANIGPTGGDFIFAVISDATANELADLGGRVLVAERPNLKSVLDLLP